MKIARTTNGANLVAIGDCNILEDLPFFTKTEEK